LSKPEISPAEVLREHLYSLRPRFDRIFYIYGDYFIRLPLVVWRTNWRILEVPVFYILQDRLLAYLPRLHPCSSHRAHPRGIIFQL